MTNAIGPIQGNALPKPKSVLVHGALEDALIWHQVIPDLDRKGYPVIAFANPLRNMTIDAAYLRSLPGGMEGSVITQAGEDLKVKAFVYAATPMPALRETITEKSHDESIAGA